MKNKMVIISLLLTIFVISRDAVNLRIFARAPDSACSLTTPTTDKPANANTAAWSDLWYRSPDQKVSASAGRWYAGDNKVLWEKPSDSALNITGQRVDDPAVRLNAITPSGYEDYDYQASGLYFPVGGCWHIKAQAGHSSLEFTVEIYPRLYRSSAQGCDDFKQAMTSSAAILIGRVEGSTSDRPGFLWETVQVAKVLKGKIGEDNHLDILHDTTYEAKMQQGQTYVFFLQSQSGSPWRLLCGGFRQLPEVVGDRLVGTIWDETLDTIQSLEARLRYLE